MIGERVNNFEIVGLLGEGGMGAVYEAKHPLIDKRVAVKLLKPELSVDAEQVQRFFNEARATSAIRHANIVEVIDLGTLPSGTPYLIMELLEGETVGERLDRVGKLEISVAVDVARQAASALEAAHARGIVHRDLKPDNLFLTPDPRLPGRELVKVLDFGIAKLRGELPAGSVSTIAGAVLGTPPYMSPEQCRGVQHEIDHRTDIYAMGIILYEMMCGHTPFEAEGLGDVMLMHMSVPPDPPSALRPELSPHLEQVILRALAKKPADRFASMAELRAALGPSAAPIVMLHSELERPSLRTMAAGGGAIPALSDSAPPPVIETLPVPVARPSPRPAPIAAVHSDAAIARTQLAVAPRSEVDEDADTDPSAGAKAAAAVRRKRMLWLSAALLGLSAFGLKHVLAPAPSQHAAVASSPPVTASNRATPTVSPAPAAAIALPPATTAPVQTLEPAQPHATASAREKSREHGAHTTKSASHHVNDVRHEAEAPAAPVAVAPSTASAGRGGVRPVASSDVSADLNAANKTAPGYLSLDSSPWSNVYLGAKLLGTTPLMHVPLPPGKHVLTLQNPELGASTSYVVDIKSGDSMSRLVGWEKK